MEPRIPEREKKAGVCYAVTADGVELPVVDVTHPTFRLPYSAQWLAEVRAQNAREHQEWARTPRLLRGFLMFLVRRRSRLMRGLAQGGGTFLSGMNTYLLKLGADNLGRGYSTATDRRIAARVPGLNLRMRLQAMAQLIADGLDLGPAGPLVLVDIAGGPALDCLNALILLRQRSPELLRGRPIRIQVLDLDRNGPLFGSRALAALTAPGAALDGLEVAFEPLAYDWSQPAALQGILAGHDRQALAGGASEGGLLEYASDAEIVANLQVLREHTPDRFQFSASFTLDTPGTRATMALSRLAHRVFAPEAVRELVASAGWQVDQAVEGPTFQCIRLSKGKASR